jgi:hypothetical protein
MKNHKLGTFCTENFESKRGEGRMEGGFVTLLIGSISSIEP